MAAGSPSAQQAPAGAHDAIRVEAGAPARRRLADPGFRAEWAALYERCPWAWVGERPEVALPWYEMYPEAEPVLVERWSPDGRLSGLLALADGDAGLALAAGDNAEYRSWLEDPAAGGAFLPAALRALRRERGPFSLQIGWMDDAVPLDWARRWTGEGAWCGIETAATWSRRVDSLEEMERWAGKRRRLRSKRNRLADRGDLVFRRYRTRDELERVIDGFFALMDFRKGAAYGLLPSRADDRKREFLLRVLDESGLIHAIGCELDGELIAAHVSVADRGLVTIQGLAHSAFYGEFSPGHLLILELLKDMSRDRLDVLDYTPGPASYKERFSDGERIVQRLVVHPDRLTAARRRLVPLVRELVARHVPDRLMTRLRAARGAGGESRRPAEEGGAHGVLMRGAKLRPRPEPGAWSANRVVDLTRVDTGDPARDLDFIRRASALAERGVDVWARLEGGRLAAAWAVERIADESTWAGFGARGWLLYPLLQPAVGSEADEASGRGDPAPLDALIGALAPEVREQLWAVSPDPGATVLLEAAGFAVQSAADGALG